MNKDPVNDRIVGEHFVEFAIDFFSLAKNNYHQHNQIRANSVAFHALMYLDRPVPPSPTMSELASELGITKQQLSKLINDLEEKQLVERIHDTINRRQVYLTITPSGSRIMAQLRADMLECTISGLSGYTKKELAELDDCLIRLSSLLTKFNIEPGDRSLSGGFSML